MFTMLFVNDVAGVPNVPWWMKHYDPPTASGMTFVDWVFGGFLFIVGMSIPQAFASRLARGDSKGRLIAHVLIRTASLLLLGVLMVNGDPSPQHTFWPRHLWAVLLYVFGIAAFVPNRYARIVGFAGLAFLAVTFRNNTGQPLQTQWWGILGLIGWAYLVASLCYLLLARHGVVVLAILVLMALWIIDRRGAFEGMWLRDKIDVGAALGSHGALALCGVVLGQGVLKFGTHTSRILFALAWGAALLGCALALLMFGINKNNGTPAWCFICAAATCWLWAILAGVIDVAGVTRPLKLFIRGGQNVLLAYLLHPLWFHLIGLLGLTFYSRIGALSPLAGIARSLLAATLILWLAAVLKDKRLRLKL
jgi:predicted acyltransferase